MREFSLLLPDGGRSAIQQPGASSAFRAARDANRSRAARDLPPVRLLHRPTGQILDVDPDADVIDLADAWAART